MRTAHEQSHAYYSYRRDKFYRLPHLGEQNALAALVGNWAASWRLHDIRAWSSLDVLCSWALTCPIAPEESPAVGSCMGLPLRGKPLPAAVSSSGH